MARMGRPPTPESHRRSVTIHVWVTRDAKEIIRAAAGRCPGQKISVWAAEVLELAARAVLARDAQDAQEGA